MKLPMNGTVLYRIALRINFCYYKNLNINTFDAIIHFFVFILPTFIASCYC